MKYSLIFLFILAACQTKKEKEPSGPAETGQWVYKTIELYSGEKFDLSDSLYNTLHKHHDGLTLTFFGGKMFSITQKRTGQAEEFIGRQAYELPGDTILRLINKGRPHDEFPVISLTDSLLKVNLFNSDLGYIVFRRIK